MYERTLGRLLIEQPYLPLLFEKKWDYVRRVGTGQCLRDVRSIVVGGMNNKFAHRDAVFGLRTNKEQLEGVRSCCLECPFGCEEAVTFWGVQNNFLRGPRCIR